MILKIFLIIILLSIILKKTVNKTNSAFSISMFLFLLFFISLSLSIVSAQNIGAFLSVYQNLVFGGIFLIASHNIIDNSNKIEKTCFVLLLSIAISVVFEFLIYFIPAFYNGFLKYAINPITTKAIDYNLSRGRIYYEGFSQTLIPIFFYFLLFKKDLKWKRFFLASVFVLIIFNSIVSNNRTFTLMALFSSFWTILLVGKFFIKRFFIKFLIFITVFYILINFVLSANKQIIGFNIVDRVIQTDELENKGTIISRFELWKLATEVGFSFPIFGIGLGNFLEYVPAKIKTSSFMQNISLRRGLIPAYHNPHNIFLSFLSEAGIINFFTLVLMFCYFFIKDIGFLTKTQNYLLKSTIISFWSLFIFAFFNPTNSIRFYIFFWFLRILIEKIARKKILNTI